MAKIGDICTKCGDVLTEENIMKDGKACKACYSKYRKEHYIANKDAILEKHKEYKNRHKEEISEQNKKYQVEYNQKNKERLSKKAKEYYIINKKRIDERCSTYNKNNKDITRKAGRKYRSKSASKDKAKKMWQNYVAPFKLIVQKHLESHPCAECGESNPVVLDFHHKIPTEKSFRISQASMNRVTEEQLRLEIDKCIILCANCHIKHENSLRVTSKTYKLKAVRDEYIKSKGSKCSNCNTTESLEFHHLDPSTKITEISHMVKTAASKEDFIAEMDKCQILCRNCHRIHHHNERQEKYENILSVA